MGQLYIYQCNKFIYIYPFKRNPVDVLNLKILGSILVNKCENTQKRLGVNQFLYKEVKLVVYIAHDIK